MTHHDSSDALVLGIDTGGTYTDGVLLEYHTHRVLATHKSLTTKRDFSIGIEQVIEGIHIEDPSAIKMVSISTTLATNAIAEGKGKRVALLLIGYDPDLIASFKMGACFATPHYYYFAGGHDLYGREKEALDLPAILTKVSEIKGQVDAIAVSSYFSPLNPEHEYRVYKAISSIGDLPIVPGHQLSTKLGSVERATTAALNASLLAVLQDFVIAVRRAMERRQIDAPLMVVRGDGTLMSDEFAARTPVETIHSGPAASAIGGRFLSKLDNALVVDVGGTTTDIALIVDGRVTISEGGAMVGEYKTAVKAANLLSIGLGGDSHIALSQEQGIAVGPERVVPLAYLAQQYPQVGKRLHVLRADCGRRPRQLGWNTGFYCVSLRKACCGRHRKMRWSSSCVTVRSRCPRLSNTTHPQLETHLRLRQPLIGIGAPANFFLKQVAKVLHTDLILPHHHQVANALGAVAGSVMVTARLAVQRATSDDMVVMEALRKEQGIVSAEDNRGLFDLDHKFHQAVTRAAHNKYLAQTLDHLFGLSRRLWYLALPQLGFLPSAVEQHVDLVKAIQAGNADRAEQVMRAHVQDFYNKVREVLYRLA